MDKPVAVLISDIHYNLHTLGLADAALRMAIAKANSLNIPVIIAGDLHDTKANLRGECISAIRATIKSATIKPIILTGNHDLINERGSAHSLEFLDELATIITSGPTVLLPGPIYGMPYQSEGAGQALRGLKSGQLVICHQGIAGAHAGEYIQDRSAVTHADVRHLQCISGHYHHRQRIVTSLRPTGGPINHGPGNWDYVGNPYTLTFGEATDPEKGFQILHQDGSLTFVPTNLRKHVIIELDIECLNKPHPDLMPKPGDLVWVKMRGPRHTLTQVSRPDVAAFLGIKAFKLDFYPTETPGQQATASKLPQPALLDLTIDETANIPADQKRRLKALWRTFSE